MTPKILAEIHMFSLFNPRRTKPPFKTGREAGASIVEVALLTPVLILILFGMIDLGRFVFLGIELTSAARAGAQYGSLSQSNASNTSAITTAAQNDVPDLLGAQYSFAVTTNTSSCWCANLPGTVVACSTSYPYTSCLTSSQIVLLQVNTQATYSPWIPFPPFNKTFTIKGQAMMPTGQY
jgi:Flp pilus assembly protein TadG